MFLDIETITIIILYTVCKTIWLRISITVEKNLKAKVFYLFDSIFLSGLKLKRFETLQNKVVLFSKLMSFSILVADPTP